MRNTALLTAILAVSAATGATARAGTVMVQNTTDNVAYNSGPDGGPADYYANGTSAVGAGAVGGANFNTSQLAVTTSLLANGTVALDLQYTTLFSGSETIGSASVSYADIFLRSSAAGYSAAPFDYAISLGDQLANGGVSAGLYAVSSYLTSQQIWSGRSGFVYGGQYAGSAAVQPGHAGYAAYSAPTVLTSGTSLASAAVTDTQAGNGYVVDVKMALSAAEAAVFAKGYDVFWGTGDCANGSFLASLPSVTGGVSQVPEPATLGVLGAGLLGLVAVRRRKQGLLF